MRSMQTGLILFFGFNLCQPVWAKTRGEQIQDAMKLLRGEHLLCEQNDSVPVDVFGKNPGVFCVQDADTGADEPELRVVFSKTHEGKLSFPKLTINQNGGFEFGPKDRHREVKIDSYEEGALTRMVATVIADEYPGIAPRPLSRLVAVKQTLDKAFPKPLKPEAAGRDSAQDRSATGAVQLVLNAMKVLKAKISPDCLDGKVVAKKDNIQIVAILRLMDLIENRCLEEEGIYRQSGSQVRVQEIGAALEKDSNAGIPPQATCNDIAGALKSILRNLRPSLLSIKAVDALQYAIQRKTGDAELQKQLALLPAERLKLISKLFQHFERVQKQSVTNRMTGENLGIVFGPNVFEHGKNPEAALERLAIDANVFKFLLGSQSIFKSKLETLNTNQGEW